MTEEENQTNEKKKKFRIPGWKTYMVPLLIFGAGMLFPSAIDYVINKRIFENSDRKKTELRLENIFGNYEPVGFFDNKTKNGSGDINRFKETYIGQEIEGSPVIILEHYFGENPSYQGPNKRFFDERCHLTVDSYTYIDNKCDGKVEEIIMNFGIGSERSNITRFGPNKYLFREQYRNVVAYLEYIFNNQAETQPQE